MKLTLKKIPLTHFLPVVLIILSLIIFIATLHSTEEKVGKPFPGYLTFKNSVVGVFYLPHWSGPERGMTHPVIAVDKRETGEIFSSQDFILTVLLPAVSGILFVLLGATLVYYYFPRTEGRYPLLLFHFLVGTYFILMPEFHLTYRFFTIYASAFALIPAAMIHFALVFPRRLFEFKRYSSLCYCPYILSFFILIPYFYFFMRDPKTWIIIDSLFLFYIIAAYLFWLLRLAHSFKEGHLEFNRIIARYLLLGQVIGFIVPLAAAFVIFVTRLSFPLNLATPLILLFPLSVHVGIILGRLRQSQMQIVLVEKKAVIGNLLGGLTHEINNPVTFIYSNIEPLQESLNLLKERTPRSAATKEIFQDLDRLVENMEEGATRTQTIIDNFRQMTYPGRGHQEAVNMNHVIEQSLNLLYPKWKGRIRIEKELEEIPPFLCSPGEMGQVFINILANACDAIQTEGTIHISTRCVESVLEVRVRDSGKGMTEREMAMIFDPFYTTKAQGEGTGLGLAITRQIVEKHGGSIEAKSVLDSGTEFTVTLPLQGMGHDDS